MNFEILRVPMLESVSEEPSWLLRGAAAVGAVSHRERYGYEDLAYTVAEFAARARNQQHSRWQMFAAVEAGGDLRAESVLGVATIGLPLRDNSHLAHLHVEVRPDARRHGIGTALWAEVERLAREAERSTWVTWTEHSSEPGESAPGAIAAPTGSGRIPGEDAGVSFAVGRGFVLEQVERHSMERVPVAADVLERFGDEAAAIGSPEYELVRWVDRSPDELVPGLCALQVAMSTDMPHGELAFEVETWDEARLRDAEAENVAAGRRSCQVAAVHRASGEVVGYTEVQVMAERPEVGFQENTIVLRAHRGHRLGMWLKVANLGRLAEEFPALRRIHTWNAEENGPMLDINVALGFEPAGVEGMWQLRLPS